MEFFLYMVFVASWFLHLTARVPVLGAVRFDLLLVVAIGILALGGRRAAGPPPPRSAVTTALIVLSAYCVLTLPFVQWPGSVIKFGFEAFLKSVVFFFFTVRLVTSERRLRWLLLVFLLCQSFRILEPVYLHLTSGYWGSAASMADWERMDRLSGAPNDVVNPNGLAFVILTVICFCHYVWTSNRIGRLAYAILLPVSIYALVLTGSRSGMVGLLVVFGAVWLKSRHKMLLTAVAIVGIAVAAPRMSADLVDRYRSVVDSSAKNAGTVELRVWGFKTGLQVALRRPLFGHGLGTSREANANFADWDQPVHNIYVEVATELGFLGLGVFLYFLWAVVRDIWRHRQEWRSAASSATLERTGDALQVFAIMNLMFGLASYGLTSYEWYFLAGLAEVLTRLAWQAEHADRPGNFITDDRTVIC